MTLDVRAVVDDGAVLYLNGAEIFRQNMPAGPVNYSTAAITPIGDAGFANPIVVPASSLMQGMNVLAVEVHQVTPVTSSSGLILTGGGLTLVEEGPIGETAPMNLARQPGVVPFVIDSVLPAFRARHPRIEVEVAIQERPRAGLRLRANGARPASRGQSRAQLVRFSVESAFTSR